MVYPGPPGPCRAAGDRIRFPAPTPQGLPDGTQPCYDSGEVIRALAPRGTGDTAARSLARLIPRPGKPLRLDLDAPAGFGRDRNLPVLDSIGIVAEEPVLPGIVVGLLDGELEILAAVRQGGQQVHREQGDEPPIGRVGRYRKVVLARHPRHAQGALDAA